MSDADVTHSTEFRAFYEDVQSRCLPGVWSKGVVLSRGENWVEDRFTPPEEIIYRLTVPERTVSLKVSLWIGDLDAHCTCGDRNEICAHIAGAAILLKTGRRFQAETASRALTEVFYHFRTSGEIIKLEREVRIGGEKTAPLRESLVSVAGAISSGRYPWPPLAASADDYRVDEWITRAQRGHMEVAALLKALSAVKNCFLDGESVRTSGAPIPVRLRVSKVGEAFEIREEIQEKIEREFTNGICLAAGVLRPIQHSEFAARPARVAALARLVTEWIPRLEKNFNIVTDLNDLPRAEAVPPVIRLETLPTGPDEIGIIPRVVYEAKFPIRDVAAEKDLEWDLKSRFQLVRDQMTRFAGTAGVNKVAELKRAGLRFADSARTAAAQFENQGMLSPMLSVDEDGFQLDFALATGKGRASVEATFRAWRENASMVPLIGGGWATLPRDWLERFGEQIENLWTAKSSAPDGKLPRVFLPELLGIVDECAGLEGVSTTVTARLRDFAEYLKQPRANAEFLLPADLRAQLRDYQRVGVQWLTRLREADLGAMLADDMGLGKTLQAICAIRGPTLIVAPASVAGNWEKEIRKFRPGLMVSQYSGSARAFPAGDVGVIITTYGILRMDVGVLAAREWDTIILDESQNIKNAESQTARATFALRGKFRVALTGTPIENRLGDLVSQFRFLNPGLLGDEDTLATVQRRVRPFILRRIKKDVALELPRRTETLLEVSLNERERDLYRSVMVAARAEVAAKLNGPEGREQNVTFRVLEILLRLRQICCDAALVPGADASFSAATSSKLQVLLESLEQSLALGHRALIFSQWTGLLDRIEPELVGRGIGFSRIDGETRNRQTVVEAFQNPDGPAVMLISLKAGGVGLTLTAADHVYILDPWWNPAVEDQAADRAHRIGQKNPVLIHRLVAKDTIEERIQFLKQEKKFIAQAVLERGEGDPSGGMEITSAEILDLLSDPV